jgi:hypothetical protein
MSKPRLNKTDSTFSNDQRINRADQIRRDNDVVRTPAVTLYDHDFAIIDFMKSVIQPKVIQNNVTIDVPVEYANGEKWAQIQAKGFMLDADAKLLAPIITIRRTDVIERDTLKGLAVNRNPGRQNGGWPERNSITLENKFSTNNIYDRFSLMQNSRLRRELYVIPVPEFVDISYELLIWTDYQEQMNSIIETLLPLSGFAWGTSYKFVTTITSLTSEAINAIGEDRLIRSTVSLLTKGVLLAESELRSANLQKQFSVKRISFGNERIIGE